MIWKGFGSGFEGGPLGSAAVVTIIGEFCDIMIWLGCFEIEARCSLEVAFVALPNAISFVSLRFM